MEGRRKVTFKNWRNKILLDRMLLLIYQLLVIIKYKNKYQINIDYQIIQCVAEEG